MFLSSTEHHQLATAVAFFIFNRPETTKQVFEAIRRSKPLRLMVVADGPRHGISDETEKCAAARAVIGRVDWPCDVMVNYSDVNLGCKRRVSSGLDWVFENAEEAIILEDDCLPHSTFFPFCTAMLEKYRDDERVEQISGNNFQAGRKRTSNSYYFSRYAHIWGWATWRRSWKQYDVSMSLWPEIRDGGWLRDLLGEKEAVAYWTDIFEKVHGGDINTWDYQLVFSSWTRSALTILPNVNLVSNIGFGAGATHLVGESEFANMETRPISFPLSHHPYMLRDSGADTYTEAVMFSGSARKKGWGSRMKRFLGFP